MNIGRLLFSGSDWRVAMVVVSGLVVSVIAVEHKPCSNNHWDRGMTLKKGSGLGALAHGEGGDRDRADGEPEPPWRDDTTGEGDLCGDIDSVRPMDATEPRRDSGNGSGCMPAGNGGVVADNPRLQPGGKCRVITGDDEELLCRFKTGSSRPLIWRV